MARNRTKILGTQIDVIDFRAAVSEIEKFLVGGQHRVVTPNPEFVLQARHDKKFQDIVNSADLAIPDGFGLLIASKFTKSKIKQTVTGSSLVPEVLRLASEQNLQVVVLNFKDGLSEGLEIEEAVYQKFPALQFRCLDIDKQEIYSLELLDKIFKLNPDIMLATFGSPLQDTWLATSISKIPSVKLAIGVGGTFDLLTGNRERAPKFWRKLGLEWLHRLFSKPKKGEYYLGRRIKKILYSAVWFPIVFVFTFNKS